MPRITGSLHEDLCVFMIISRGIILIMGNVSDRSCKEIKTHFICNNFFPEHRAVCEIMWENMVEPYRLQMTIRSMLIACCIIKSTNTHSEYVTTNPTATMVTRRPLGIT